MSVLVKGMEMPTNCKECKIACEPYLSLDGLLGKISMSDSVRCDCPLIEVPTPHGRLVDADELKKKWLEAENRMGADKVIELPLKEYITNGCVYDLDNAPTIIEREK